MLLKDDEYLFEQSHKNQRGKLRIYFGYAAGVGKTCAMLHDAREAKENGADVVAGYIEPHIRPETTALLSGIEELPPTCIEYKGRILREFNLDGALKRKPQLILVDELAHTNAEGCRHKKRYQDVEELLQAGIDVYTTVNVQHIESLHDMVVAVTGVSVHERIPDKVFDNADQVEIVDIEPDDLIERLHKGKIYKEDQAIRALNNFFTKEKLTALREIALRKTAEQVIRSAEHITVQQKNAESKPYGNEHILICLSSAPSNAKAIRTAARMADALRGSFTALFVETPDCVELQDKSKIALRENLRLAEQLGAQIATVYGEDVAYQIAEYAKESRITKIVMGRSAQAKRWFMKQSLVDRLTAAAPNLDIYIIPDTQPSQKNVFRLLKPAKLTLVDVLKSALGLVICTLLGEWFAYLGFSETNIITLYILGVLINSLITTGLFYGVGYSVLSVLLFNYFFTDPLFSLDAYGSGYPITFVIMLSSALLTSTLVKKVKRQARQAAQKACRTEVLLETNHKLQQAKGELEIMNKTAGQLIKLLEKPVIVYLAKKNELSEPQFFGDENSRKSDYCGDAERAVACWVYTNNKRAGATTNTLSAAKCLYMAVRGGNNVLAVIGIAVDKSSPPDPFQKNLMIAILGECGLALEKEKLYEAQKVTEIQMEQEQLRANLLRAISHDLRTPLTSISGNAGILLNNFDVVSEEQKRELNSNIYDDAIWLTNLVENLLSITRIEDKKVHLNLQPELLEEVINEALRHISRQSAEHHIKTVLNDDLLMAKMDSRLVVQVIINLVDNAIKYTGAGSHITISAKRRNGFILVEVADDGPGIPDGIKPMLFDLFYTADNARSDARRGLGLGLYLCKAILEAHGGEIIIKDNDPKGSVFGFTLQAEEAKLHE